MAVLGARGLGAIEGSLQRIGGPRDYYRRGTGGCLCLKLSWLRARA